VGTENESGAIRNVVEILDKLGSLSVERIHHVLVVDDLVANVNRRAISLQR
jgi:hypothetical protein